MPEEPSESSLLDSNTISDGKNWEPWGEEGPKLRVESFTAQQLAFLTPEAIHFESRSEFIGDFPPQWVENHCNEWQRAVDKHVEIARGDAVDLKRPTRRNVHRHRRLVDLQLADQIAGETSDRIRSHESKRERLNRQMRRRRRRFREDQLREVFHHHRTESPDPSETETRSNDETRPDVKSGSHGEITINNGTRSYDEARTNPEVRTHEAATSHDQTRTNGAARIDGSAGSSDDTESAFASVADSDSSNSFEADEFLKNDASRPKYDMDGLAKKLQELELPRFRRTENSLSAERLAIASAEPESEQSQYLGNGMPTENGYFRHKAHHWLSRFSASNRELDDPELYAPSEISGSSTIFYDAAAMPSSASTGTATPPSEYSYRPMSTNASVDDLGVGNKQYTPPRVSVGEQLSIPRSEDGDRCRETPSSGSNSSLDATNARTAKNGKKVRMLTPHTEEQTEQELQAPAGDQSDVHSLPPSSFTQTARSLLWPHPHLHFNKNSHRGPKIYQGRFLVQQRRSRQLCPNVNEFDDPLATKLVTRWKECAVLVRRNDSMEQPLTLYFYKSSNMDTMPLKVPNKASGNAKAKNDGLEYKLKLDRKYRIAFYSPLDLSLAIWRPRTRRPRHRKKEPQFGVGHRILNHHQRTKGDNGNNTSDFTHVLIIHAQSITAIMDLAYLITAATGAAPALYGPTTFAIEIPSINVKAQVNSVRNNRFDSDKFMRSITSGCDEMVTYKDLMRTVVSVSPSSRSIINCVWDLVKSLPTRFVDVAPERNSKFAIAWIMTGLSHRPVWIPSASSTMYPINRLNFLLGGRALLNLVQPVPKCFLGDKVEPAPVEGYCGSIDVVVSASVRKHLSHSSANYVSTSDFYLMFAQASEAVPSMLASSQNTDVKTVSPYALDETGQHIRWIKSSTCLAEIDRHDAIAKIELERRSSLVSNSRGFLNLLLFDTFDIVDETDIELSGDKHPSKFRIGFHSAKLAQIWCEKLREIAQYWQDKYQAWMVKRIANIDNCDYTITTFLHNRAIIYSGPLFLKRRRFATFKPHFVILTASEIVVFRIAKTLRAPAQPHQTYPASSLNYRRVLNIDLRRTYVYSGQTASHVLLDDDSYNDPGNPGVRALPRSYEHGWISTDTESDRCFVLLRSKKPLFERFSSGLGNFYAFLAPEKEARDEWVTSIRYVQTALILKSDEVDMDAKLHLEDDDDD